MLREQMVKQHIIIGFLSLLMISSCNSQSKTNSQNTEEIRTANQLSKSEGSQIGEYVSGIFEDSKGNLWFSTISKGVAKYDGKRLVYDTSIGSRVGSIVEDTDGNLWFGTHSGIYKFDGSTFTNFTVNDGLCDNRVTNIIIDNAGTIWVGTWGGVCKFNGEKFVNFPIPKPNIELLPYQTTMNWIREIKEDSKGNIWIGRDGYGATKFDGKKFTFFTKKDGLASNNITDIQEDKQGDIWFSSRITENDHPDPNKRFGAGGLVKFNGKTFINFPELEGLYNSNVYQIYKDTKENIWISTVNKGVYKYDGKQFTNYRTTKDGNPFSKPIMSILEDSKGSIWLGCAGGLFRLDSDGIINVTTNGPWK